MIKYTSANQLSIDDFLIPQGKQLNPNNRWIKLAKIIPKGKERDTKLLEKGEKKGKEREKKGTLNYSSYLPKLYEVLHSC